MTNRLSLPSRRTFGIREFINTVRVFLRCWLTGVDFGFNGYFQNRFTLAFQKWSGCKYCLCVSSGTAGLWIAFRLAKISHADEVLVSPLTNPGSVMPASILGAKVVVADSKSDSYEISFESFISKVSNRTKAVVVTHYAGIPCSDILLISEYCSKNNIFLIEDCSQAHGSIIYHTHVGSFGDVAVWSTMFSKTISTGSCGGVIATNSSDLFSLIRSHSDRGKYFDSESYNPRDMHLYRFPSLNLVQSEIPCAIGLASLSKISSTIKKRSLIASWFREYLHLLGSSAVLYTPPFNSEVSYFFLILTYPSSFFPSNKQKFARLATQFNIPINAHSRELVSEWNWLEPISPPSETPNALSFRNRSIHLLYHERFTYSNVKDICSALKLCEDIILESVSP
tara:strand:- start:1239 stop:2426 length:1188 start_codon:yes stop_codon:yes gene_type:complete